MKIAIQGTLGSFHEEATRNLFPDEVSTKIMPCTTFEDVFSAVKSGTAEKGVVAIENNIFGSINTIYRLFNRYEVWIEAETTVHIQQYLIAAKKTSLENIQKSACTILSQAPALAQCELWLTEHTPQAIRQETSDTAASVQTIVSKQNPSLLAVASKRAADLCGAYIVAGPINDDPHNYTRFVLLSPTKTVSKNANRSTIILTTSHAPGALVRALNVFAQKHINLSKLDSHPIVQDARHYQFYIDVEAGLQEESLQEAFQELKEQGCVIKILGSYHY